MFPDKSLLLVFGQFIGRLYFNLYPFKKMVGLQDVMQFGLGTGGAK